MAWAVEYAAGVEKQLRKLGPDVSVRIRRYMERTVGRSEDVRAFGAPLVGELSGLWRYRVGDYRIICKIQDDVLVVLVIEIGHRREVYR